jgi:uncharacterized protein YecE (DUF72 family)
MSFSVGLGSWADREYVGLLYPKGTVAAKRLGAYAQVFTRVEVNSTYYAAPRQNVVAGWAKQTPAGFKFDIKLHRAFSQSPEKTTRESELPRYFLDGVRPLIRARKLGVFLLVAAPTFRPERNRLEQLDALAAKLKPHRLAVELRHRDWVAGRSRARTLDFFRERGLVWVCVDLPGLEDSSLLPPVDAVTNPNLGYVRLHGRNKSWLKATSAAERHRYEYPAPELRAIAARLRRLAHHAEHVHVVANNHAHDFAPKTALALQRLLGRDRAA